MDNIQSMEARLKSLIARTTVSSGTQSLTYKCSKCRDTGWIEAVNEDGIRLVGKCACRLAREAEQRLIVSGLAESIEQQTFDSFETITPVQKAIKNTALGYVDALFRPEGNKRPWLYIGGNPGSGKTHICTAVCGEVLKRNVGVRYMQWLNESRRLKTLVNDEDFEDYVSDYVNVSLLYIDDLLKQKYPSEWA